MIKEASKEQYYTVLGLLAAARNVQKQLLVLEATIESVLKVKTEDRNKSGEGDPGHITDAVYSLYTVDELFDKLGIKKKEK